MDTRQCKLLTLEKDNLDKTEEYKINILKPIIRNGKLYIKNSKLSIEDFERITDELGNALIDFYNGEYVFNDKLIRYLPTRKRELAKSSILYSDIYLALDVDTNKLIGFIKLHIRKNTINVNQLYICNEYRQRGYGSELLKFAETIAVNQMKKILTISVYEENEIAKLVYLKYGFK